MYLCSNRLVYIHYILTFTNCLQNDSSATESPKQETSKQNGKQGSPQTGKGDGQDFGIPQAESTPKKLGDQSASPAVGQLVDVPLQDEGTPNNTTDVCK